jgi:hypothetical protein
LVRSLVDERGWPWKDVALALLRVPVGYGSIRNFATNLRKKAREAQRRARKAHDRPPGQRPAAPKVTPQTPATATPDTALQPASAGTAPSAPAREDFEARRARLRAERASHAPAATVAVTVADLPLATSDRTKGPTSALLALKEIRARSQAGSGANAQPNHPGSKEPSP